jgi:CubicO group peptidase (beta-lactamase class C family)
MAALMAGGPVTTMKRIAGMVWVAVTLVPAPAWTQQATAPPATAPPAVAPVASNPKVAAALEVVRVWLDAQRDYEQIPGLSAAIVLDQDVLWIGGIGQADLAAKRAATADTIYSICSISKLFTSIAVMQQRDAGRLRLDDPVKAHLPWLEIQETAPEAGPATIEGLLTHASGLPRESDQAYWTGPGFTFPTREEIIAGLKRQKTLYPAETYFQYSNLGITLAGEVAAAKAGQPYAALVRSQILDPLGLASTFPDMPAGERGRRLATGYGAIGRDGTRAPMPFFEARGIAPAAGYASTAADLARFASWQFRLLAKGGTEVLAANTLREMHRVHWVDPDFETSWGLGFSVSRSGGKTFVGHGGSCPGFRSHLLLKTDERVATVFMANAQGVDAPRFVQAMYDLVAPAIKEATKPDAPAPKPADASLDTYLGSYSSGFAGEVAFVRWEDGLASLGLPTTDPVRAITKWKKTGDHTFRRVRKDEALGEEVVFTVGADGKATQLTWHSNVFRRVR